MNLSHFAPERLAETQLSSLGLLDEEHMATFRNALEKLLLIGVSESTYAEIFDGLPTLDSWNEFHYWVPAAGNPVIELGHKELCAGSREKTQKLVSEFDIHVLLFPSQVCQSRLFSDFHWSISDGYIGCARLLLQSDKYHPRGPSQGQTNGLMSWKSLLDFQDARHGTKEHIPSLVELLARSCHQLAAFIFQLNDGVHKHALYEAWRDAPEQREPGCKRPPCAFSNTVYQFYEQYPNGIADVVGYWAESKIFGGVVVFDRGPSGTEVSSQVLVHTRYSGWLT